MDVYLVFFSLLAFAGFHLWKGGEIHFVMKGRVSRTAIGTKKKMVTSPRVERGSEI